MSWIRSITADRADEALARRYERLAGDRGQLDHILLVHGLLPHTLDGHMALYRSVLHHPRNPLHARLAEAIGIRVSLINGCDYCVAHHSRGLRAACDSGTAARCIQALRDGRFEPAFTAAEAAALRYADRLTRSPATVELADIERLRAHGWNDAAILQINQVAAYFGYANRVVLGLGVKLEGGMGVDPPPEAI
ncbi:MAG: peroxidase-related enzyme [Pseudomonadota bacterium]|nr:MAG: peroxidase-related enzyme [Pseudomonadota bacterium]